jgi:hypothetical protein
MPCIVSSGSTVYHNGCCKHDLRLYKPSHPACCALAGTLTVMAAPSTGAKLAHLLLFTMVPTRAKAAASSLLPVMLGRWSVAADTERG